MTNLTSDLALVAAWNGAAGRDVGAAVAFAFRRSDVWTFVSGWPQKTRQTDGRTGEALAKCLPSVREET